MSMNKMIIEIHEPKVNPELKFMKALFTLSKATGIKFEMEHKGHTEPTPYQALRDLDAEVKKEIEDGLMRVFREIVVKWLHLSIEKAKGDDPFKLKGKTYINPKTGRALTVREWKSIQRDMTKIFGALYDDQQEALTKKALALGKVLEQMNPDDRITTPLDDLNLDSFITSIESDDMYRNIMQWADLHTGELIQDMTGRSRRAVVNTIMQGYQDGWTSRKLQTELFDKFSDLNRDWRRIAETETATNFNNGYLITEAGTRVTDEPIYMKGLSGAGACDFCISHVNNQVVVLLDDAPAGGDSITIDGKSYTAIWPGKNNFGRKRANWWVSSGSQHPHCRCTWTRYYAEIEDYEKKLRAALET